MYTLRRIDYLYRIYFFRIVICISLLVTPVVTALTLSKIVSPMEDLNPVYIVRQTIRSYLDGGHVYRIYYYRASDTKLRMNVVMWEGYLQFYFSCLYRADGDMICYIDSTIEGMYNQYSLSPALFKYSFDDARKIYYRQECQFPIIGCNRNYVVKL